MGVKERYSCKKWLLSTVGLSSVKWLQIGTDMLLIVTSTGDELLRNVNIDDLEP